MKVTIMNDCVNFTIAKMPLIAGFVQNIEKCKPAPKTQNFKKYIKFELKRFLLFDIL